MFLVQFRAKREEIFGGTVTVYLIEKRVPLPFIWSKKGVHVQLPFIWWRGPPVPLPFPGGTKITRGVPLAHRGVTVTVS